MAELAVLAEAPELVESFDAAIKRARGATVKPARVIHTPAAAPKKPRAHRRK